MKKFDLKTGISITKIQIDNTQYIYSQLDFFKRRVSIHVLNVQK